MIGIVIPAHDEECLIGPCLAAALRAAAAPELLGEPVETIVVLDQCTDRTAIECQKRGVRTLSVEARNVGMARAAGADALLARGARWLAFTDADSEVGAQWLVEQLGLCADAVCGSISVTDWKPHGEHADLLHRHFLETYRDCDGHRHVHGANLGVSAQAYRRAGGFQPMTCSEDEALVNALQATGARIAWSAKPRVTTSARRHARAPGGFADALVAAVARQLAGGPAVVAT